jgi:hypothetical protein
MRSSARHQKTMLHTQPIVVCVRNFRNRNNSHTDTNEDHRRYVPFIKHEHGSLEDDETAKKAEEQKEREHAEKMRKQEERDAEIARHADEVNAHIDAHNYSG